MVARVENGTPVAGNRPEERVRLPILYQSWRHVAFLHWRYDPETVQRLLPAGLACDLVDGSAWVGLTPFLVEGFRLAVTPSLPVVSRFPETNLRTYVVDGDGNDGLWFFSLDVDSAVMVAAARLGLGIPYVPADMRVEPAETVRYESRRLADPPATHRIEIRPGAEVSDLSARDAALIGRWRAFARPAGRLVQVPVEHQPWPVRTATVVELDESVTRAAGLPAPDHEPVVHYSDGVDARFGPPRAARAEART
ncbi:MAG: hypothetical protein CYG61_05945 [Actinobacteria bacterium]|nr:MAG: hypothetical protein CYG61_05945 [Actinomycetota bacterium]